MVLESLDLGPLGAEDVEVQVEHCGLCHSDLSILRNEWGVSQYPAVLGHEVVGRVTAVGPAARLHHMGDRVGIGWFSGSDMSCRQCLAGRQHLCPQGQATIIGHTGGFANRLRAHWAWAFPLPGGLDAAEAGPLLCGGITVFAPLSQFARPTDRLGIIGIGGLGHMAVKFAAAFGCEVTAFTSSEKGFDEARRFGAHHAVSTRDQAGLRQLAGQFDLLLSTVAVKLDWAAIIELLGPEGRLHNVGIMPEPIDVPAFPLISKERSVSGSPGGSLESMTTMLDFAARKGILPQTEHFPMSQINQAFARLAEGKAHYRIVLDADF
jgi:uncharacterized zinc-type alcohol dehydrogenase-like protein